MLQGKSKYKIGMRTLKTGLAVTLSIILSELLDLKSPSLVGIAAIVSMQSSVNESFIAGKNRMLGTFVGAFVGLIFSFLLPHNYLFLGLGIVVVIHIHNIFKWKQSLSLSAIVFLIVFLYQDGEYSRLIYAINRLLDTSIGIVVSMLVNYFIAQPDNKQSFNYLRDHLYGVMKDLIYQAISDNDLMDKEEFREQMKVYKGSFEALKSELHMDSSNNRSNKAAIYIATVLDKLEKNLLTILELNIIPILNDENLGLFNQLYKKEYLQPEREGTNTDIIYNYHINKIFKKLLDIESYWNVPL